ncbi:MAG: thioesterase family protein [Lachnospiraceae bacterium]|jgi:fluoroacetyl-CoA thioesterase
MDKAELYIGLEGEARTVVNESNTAAAVGSGILQVFGTPMMIALMEEAACDSVKPFLADGEGTVGISVDITHEAATPVGMEVTATARLVEIDRRRLLFEVEAFDEAGRIGGGTHERFIINNSKFQAGADAKRNP